MQIFEEIRSLTDILFKVLLRHSTQNTCVVLVIVMHWTGRELRDNTNSHLLLMLYDTRRSPTCLTWITMNNNYYNYICGRISEVCLQKHTTITRACMQTKYLNIPTSCRVPMMRRGCKRSTLLAFLAFLTWVGGLTIAIEPSDNPIVIS